MTIHSLFPAFVVIDYHSPKAPHKMTIPTRAWNNLAGTAGQGGFEAWDASDRDAVAMVEELAEAVADYYPSEVIFDSWTIYTMTDIDARPIPKAGGILASLTGGAVTPGWFYAVQGTMEAYDTEFNTCKLVLLDTSSLGNFFQVPLASLDAKLGTLYGVWSDVSNAWASRAGFKPNILRTWNVTINDKLYNTYNR